MNNTNEKNNEATKHETAIQSDDLTIKGTQPNVEMNLSGFKEDKDASINDFDPTKFQNNDNQNILECGANDYTKCQFMNRLLLALEYYSKIDILQNQDDRNFFDHFMNEIYCQLLDDYNHFINHHSSELEQITQSLKSKNKCQVTNCQFTTRHYRCNVAERKITTNDELDTLLDFYRQTMDSLHFYLFHLYECGLRTSTINITEKKENDTKKHQQYVDKEFAEMMKTISETRNVTKSFDRFSTQNNHKYKIDLNEECIEDDNGDTVLDQSYLFLKNYGVSQRDVQKLAQFIISEEFDSEAVEYDVDMVSNIANHIQNPRVVFGINHFMHRTQLIDSTFATGYIFYYWNYYHKSASEQIDKIDQSHKNTRHNGVS
eukprot:359363_1